MKRFEIKWPYVIKITRVTFPDVEEHPDPEIKEKMLELIGPINYHAWGVQYRNGYSKEYEVRSRMLVKDLFLMWFTSPERLGILLGYLLVGIIGMGIFAAIGLGIKTVIQFIGGMM